ncbi:MAG: hypothetical protein A2583_06485 [Bdellovibrionales bacterium RIFOXYD1_FULL_53_11]|nr:MAG: hypothetical protein A2583_06485 [Bdellovibrionales bacterium RIFOXYD1_FULL_53_11]
MKKIILAAVITIAFAGAGCAGLLFTHVKQGVTATANSPGNRTGEACTTGILGLVAFGDGSIETARANGGITAISTVDQSTFSIPFGLYARRCTIVRGR